MAAPARAFECAVCGRPLGAGRLKQGVRVHRECRRAPERPPGECRRAPERSPAPDEAAAALARAQATVASLSEGASDLELRELFARAAAQARELVGDLERLRSLGAGPQR